MKKLLIILGLLGLTSISFAKTLSSDCENKCDESLNEWVASGEKVYYEEEQYCIATGGSESECQQRYEEEINNYNEMGIKQYDSCIEACHN